MNADTAPTLLSIVELGGYPNFAPLYARLGYRVVTAKSMRKALSVLKTERPEVIVAEFNYDPQFRDRIGNLDSLMANVQRFPDTRVIVLYDKEHAHQLARLRERFSRFDALPFPLEEGQLEAALRQD
jgi:DNA-binding NtrC family response regulator